MSEFGFNDYSTYTVSVTSKGSSKKPEAEGYVVKKGETPTSIAKKFNMSVGDVKKLLKGKNLQSGAVLKLPSVKFEKSLASIAKKYNMSVAELLDLNKPQITDPTKIKKGQTINVPAKPFKSEKAVPVRTEQKTDTTAQSKPEISKPDSNYTDSRKVRLGDGRVVKAATLIKSSNDSSSAEVGRPIPTLDKNGKIVADVRVFKPTKTGVLSGRTIIVNAGHGGYNPKTGDFDIGAEVKDKGVEEWIENQFYSSELIRKLRDKGAKIVYVAGNVEKVAEIKEKYSKADMFISLHCNSYKDKSVYGPRIMYKNEDKEDARLAQSIEQSLDTHSQIDPQNCRTKPEKLFVLNKASEMPSTLIEIGFVTNEDDLEKMQDPRFRNEYTDKILDGILNYYKTSVNKKG